jgi:anti-sigma-K factor RskA
MSVDIHVTELLPGYALGCLDEADAILVAEHLAVCDDCRAEVIAYQAVVDEMALAAPSAEPPPGLKLRLMDRARPSRPVEFAQPQTSWWRHLTRLMQRSAPAWGVASLVLIVALVTSNLWLWRQLNRPEEGAQPGMLHTILLAGTETAPQATGLIVISADGEHGTLVVDSLAVLGQDQQYQLWLIQDGERTNGGVFSVNPEGYGSLWVESPQPLSSYSAFGITIEPAGGSTGPTGDKVLGSTL